MKTTRVLQTNITETTVKEVANILNTSIETRVAICNANTLVRCSKNSQLKDVVCLSHYLDIQLSLSSNLPCPYSVSMW